MLLTNPYLFRYSDAYRRQLFMQFNLFGNHNYVEALRINVSRFGKTKPAVNSASEGFAADKTLDKEVEEVVSGRS